MSTNNPLLNIAHEIPFNEIRPEHVKPAVESLLAQAEASLERIEQSAKLNYESVLGALDVATEPLEKAMGAVSHLETVASNSELREVYNAVRPEVSEFYAGIPLRPELWSVLKAYSETPESKQLSGAQSRYLKKTIDEFRRNGADLNEQDKVRLREISRELAELTSKFSQNVLDETAAFELLVEDISELSGLPESAIAAARADAKAKGKTGYRFTLQAPSLISVLTYLDNRDTRETLWRAYNTRASREPFNNAPIVQKIIALRNEQARLLGYPEFAALVLEDRMAKTTGTAQDFVQDLRTKTEPFFARETEQLKRFQQKFSPGAPALEPWDVGYYSEKQRQALFDFDQEQLRPYLPIDRVMQGLFETAKRLYSVDIKANSRLPVWHDDVRAYDIHDTNGEHIASFYADLFPREEKRGGAWMNSFISGTTPANGSRQSCPHLGLICTNVTPPVDDKPALLTHDELTTMFHEFGHLLHHCLSRVSVRSLVGTNVAWDFVELPSQIMENWCWEREALDSFATHYVTGETIPGPLFEKMTQARSYRAASATMRQLGFAAVDLALHVEYSEDRNGDFLAYARDMLQPYGAVPFPDDYAMLAAFTHLFASPVGYAAGYYSYKWAEVLDADAFTRFKREGIFSPVVGDAFRRSVLEPGDSDDPMNLYKRFMGRGPSLDALMERSGLSSAA